MADEFDAFDEDFEMVYPTDTEGASDISETREEQESNPLKAILKKILENKYLKVGIILGLLAIVIIFAILIISNTGKPSYDEAMVNPNYYSLPEYKFWLDENIDGYSPYILLQLELVFDTKYKTYESKIGDASYQIQNRIINDFVKNMTYYDIKSVEKRKEVYKRSMEYINRILDTPIIKEVLESRFEMDLMRR